MRCLTDPSRALSMDFTVGFWTGITLSLVIFEVSFRWSLGKDWRKKLRHLAVLSDGAIGLDHDVVRTSETLPLVTIRHTVAATITIWFSSGSRCGCSLTEGATALANSSSRIILVEACGTRSLAKTSGRKRKAAGV
jgi:hypothetical protein